MHMWNLKNTTNEKRKRKRQTKKPTLNYAGLMVTRGEEGGEMGETGDRDKGVYLW